MNSMVVTLGTSRYRVDRPWPTADMDFGAICEVGVLADGRVAMVRRKAPHILLFSSDGRLVDQWDVPGLVCAHYLRADDRGGALLTDLDGHQVMALGPPGDVLWTLGDPSTPNWMAPFNHPTCACSDDAGNLYVTDGYGNSCLHCFDADRRLRHTVGAQGNGLGQFTTPHAVIHVRGRAVSHAGADGGRLWVSDRENNRLQIFTMSGRPEREIRDVFKPMALGLLPDGTVLVTDQTPRLSRFDQDGTLLGRCRTFSTVAHGLGVGPDGVIYLAEMGPDVLTRLVPL